MARRIRITVEDEASCTATLLEEEAPETCDAVWAALPITETMYHAKFSGEETLIELEGEDMIVQDPENWEYNVAPRDVGFWFSTWGDNTYERGREELAEIVFIYGRRVRLRTGPDRPTAANLFARITSGFEAFQDAAGRVHSEGPKVVTIERADETGVERENES